MATYAQPSSKRQKVTRVSDGGDYFQGIDKLEYCGPSGDILYRYFNSSERGLGRPVDDWLKIAVNISTVRYDGSDTHGRPTFNRSWDDATTIDHNKKCLKTTFDLCTKLGVKYWSGFDSDFVPEDRNWEEIAEFVQEQMGRTCVKPLWIAPDLHSHSRYATGAFTSNEASTYARAAAQVKRTLDMCQRFNSECFLLCPYRDGYESIFKTDMNKELKLFAKLLKMSIDYKERINYRGEFLLMPYDCLSDNEGACKDFCVGKYMEDVMSCMYFLRHFGFERMFKVVAKPGRQMFMANAYNMLGGVSITNDCDPHDTKKWTLMMKSIIKQGAPLPGGITLSVPPPRTNSARAQLMFAPAVFVDALARGLRAALRLEQDQVIGKYLQQKYSSYYSGPGARLFSGEMTLEECEEFDKKNQQQHIEPAALRSDLADQAFQKHLDNVDMM